jgi:peptide/nickel transport system substrate-binding protein
MASSAVLFAAQAQAAGVNVQVRKSPVDTYYTDFTMKGLVAQDDWNNRSIASQISQSLTSKSLYNETQWRHPQFDRRAAQAAGTLDLKKRRELYYELQKMLWNEGGYIIWGFANFVDAYRKNVQGFRPHVFLSLGYYGFESVWFA